TSNTHYTSLRLDYGQTSGYSRPFSCHITGLTGLNIEYFRVVPLANISGTEEFRLCENKTIKVVQTSAQVYCTEMSYGLEYRYGNSGNWSALLPYGINNISTTISIENFPGFTPNLPLHIRAKYTNRGSNDEYS